MKSDSETTLQELKDWVRRFRDERDWEQFHNPKDLCIALSVEAAELLELCRFTETAELERRIRAGELPQFAQEMSDVLSYLLSLSVRLDIDLTDSLRDKMAINASHYPVELARGRKAKYTELLGITRSEGAAAPVLTQEVFAQDEWQG